MDISSEVVIDIAQTVAIIATLIATVALALWQWEKTRKTITIDNYSKMIAAMNTLRDIRIQVPALERALFKNRETWKDDEIRKRVYGIELANIFEWVFLSHKNGLIDDKEWSDWSSMWKRVILSDESMRELMEDETIYTFSLDAHKLIKNWIDEMKEAHDSKPLSQEANWKDKYFQALGISYLATCVALLGAWLKIQGWVRNIDIVLAVAFGLGGILLLLLRNRIPEQVRNRMASVRTNHLPLFIGLVLLGLNFIVEGYVPWGIVTIYVGYAFLLFVVLAQFGALIIGKRSQR